MSGIVLGQQDRSASTVDPRALSRRAAVVVGAVALVLLLGVAIDLATLWVIQRQDTLEWELVALGTTTNSFPLCGLGVTLLYGYLVLSRSSSLAAYRSVAALTILLGAFGLLVGFLVGTNYLAITKAATLRTEALPIFKSIVVKTGGISGLYGLLMIVSGALAWRRPPRA